MAGDGTCPEWTSSNADHFDSSESGEELKLSRRVRPSARLRARTRTTEDFGQLRTSTASSISEDQSKKGFKIKALICEHSGSDIARRYIISGKELGAGGYGKVYLAKDRMFNNRLVAIKKILKTDTSQSSSLQSEVAIMKDLDHPSICRLFETYEDDRFMQFVIEYLEGGDLFDRYMDKGKLEEDIIAAVVKQVASALRYAHRNGIAHRDMKLENICFCDRDELDFPHVKVIDWGLGKYFLDGKMSSNIGCGMYSAPEVIECDPEEMSNDGGIGYTNSCDLWSLGVVTYVSICGKPPFWGGPLTQLKNMKAEKYPMKNGVWETTSENAKDFIRRLLQPNPQDRMQLADVITHPWLNQPKEPEMEWPLRRTSAKQLEFARVLSNLEQFSHAPSFFSICIASVARQLDYRGLRGIHDVFSRIDTNGDGFITQQELKDSFLEVFGEDSTEYRDADQIFKNLDLDATGVITYTEFCAAGLGESMFSQEHVLWAAFKTFDLSDNGRVSASEMQQVLSRADVNHLWTASVCKEVARNVMDGFGSEEDCITFADWLDLMRECRLRQDHLCPRRISKCEQDAQHQLTMLNTFAAASKATTTGTAETDDVLSEDTSVGKLTLSRDESGEGRKRVNVGEDIIIEGSACPEEKNGIPATPLPTLVDPSQMVAAHSVRQHHVAEPNLLRRQFSCCFPFL